MTPRRKAVTITVTYAALLSALLWGTAKGAAIVDERYVHVSTRTRDSIIADSRFRATMDTLRAMTRDLTACIKHRDLCP